MSAIIHFLTAHGGLLLLGWTIILTLGYAGARWITAPILAQRFGEISVAALLIWTVLACLPLPRANWSPVGTSVRRNVAHRRQSERVGAWQAPQKAQVAFLPAPRERALTPLDPRHPSVNPFERISCPSTRGGETKTWVPDAELLAKAPDKPKQDRASDPITKSDAVSKPLAAREFVNRDARRRATSDSPRPKSPESVRTPGKDAADDGHRKANLGPVVAWLYLIGALGSLLWLTLGRVLLVRWVWASHAAPERIAEMCRAAWPSDRRAPRVLVSSRCGRPLSFGLWRKTILMPESLTRAKNASLARHVLRHEASHGLQGDAWWQGLVNAALPLVYFHPLYWRLRREIDLRRELLADDFASAASCKVDYARDLLQLARARVGYSRSNLAALGAVSSASQLKRRLTMLLSRNETLARSCAWRWRVAFSLAALVIVALLTWTLGVSPALADDDPSSDDTRKVVASTLEGNTPATNDTTSGDQEDADDDEDDEDDDADDADDDGDDEADDENEDADDEDDDDQDDDDGDDDADASQDESSNAINELVQEVSETVAEAEAELREAIEAATEASDSVVAAVASASESTAEAHEGISDARETVAEANEAIDEAVAAVGDLAAAASEETKERTLAEFSAMKERLGHELEEIGARVDRLREVSESLQSLHDEERTRADETKAEIERELESSREEARRHAADLETTFQDKLVALQAEKDALVRELEVARAEANAPREEKANVELPPPEATPTAPATSENAVGDHGLAALAGANPSNGQHGDTEIGAQGSTNLIELASKYEDARTAVELSEIDFELLKEKVEASVAGQSELRRAEVQLRSARRKFELLRKIAQALSEAGLADLKQATEGFDLTERMFAAGNISSGEMLAARSRVAKAQANLDILRLIVEQ